MVDAAAVISAAFGGGSVAAMLLCSRLCFEVVLFEESEYSKGLERPRYAHGLLLWDPQLHSKGAFL